VFNFIYENILKKEFDFKDKEHALKFFQKLRQLFKGLNSAEWESKEFKAIEAEISASLQGR